MGLLWPADTDWIRICDDIDISADKHGEPRESEKSNPAAQLFDAKKVKKKFINI